MHCGIYHIKFSRSDRAVIIINWQTIIGRLKFIYKRSWYINVSTTQGWKIGIKAIGTLRVCNLHCKYVFISVSDYFIGIIWIKRKGVNIGWSQIKLVWFNYSTSCCRCICIITFLQIHSRQHSRCSMLRGKKTIRSRQ